MIINKGDVMNSRNTKQKQIILDTLCCDKTHPTMYQLCDKILEKNPDCGMGQATVYRNINRLVKEGSVRKISLLNEVDHYDGDISEHYHLICKKCGKIKDIFDDELISHLEKIKKNHHIVIDHYQILFEGVCKTCLNGGSSEEV